MDLRCCMELVSLFPPRGSSTATMYSTAGVKFFAFECSHASSRRQDALSKRYRFSTLIAVTRCVTLSRP